MKRENKILTTEQEKLQIRLAMTHEERFRLLMRLIRLGNKMKNATIIYPNSK